MASSNNAVPRGKGLLDRFVSIREWLRGFPLSIVQLAMRIGVGLAFFSSGLLKYRSFDYATQLLLAMILAIQIVYPSSWADHVLWGSILIFLLTRGPGPFSIDYLIERYFRKRRQSNAS